MEQNDYFAWRNVTPSMYENYRLPVYLSSTLASFDKGAAILDFGCGFGQLLIALKEAGYENVEGADINPAAIAHLRSRSIVVHDLSVETVFYEASKSKYDLVIMSHILEHFPKKDIISLLKKIRDLLKPQGWVIIMVPNAQSNTGCYWAYEDFTHETLFTAGSLYYVLRAAGYTSVEFLDVDCTLGVKPLVRVARKILLSIYRFNYAFWNKVTGSAFHAPTPQIFSYEIKVIARK
ncbi:hypothetical protein TDMWS_09660 [Thermodesulfomicrobium sp. WS]|jgi:SAM-dependent methyltransferase|uniref:class I SAM-dependent methyltransferase n=1 Tax=Thermodesulfomicrobium sp. WS TaxID=3004129 RepID=UPI00249101C4|nr:class I SAM-dependent methyltransferase [Thermodesulfomicrobium sp. WS]BDV00881.1 hypothetical protein TDMWS_09660 [Thermodesulfomicrobium sp. WS]